MRILLLAMCSYVSVQAQDSSELLLPLPSQLPSATSVAPGKDIKLGQLKWKMTGNRWLTGGLVFLAGASKGFNETLMFHWKAFRHHFPNANPKWYNPDISWRNKYKNGDPDAGPRFPLSTTLLVGLTDQYHLNTFINRMSWTSAVVIKFGEGKRPLKHYIYDLVYYSACHQAGFALTYYPFKAYKGN